MTDNTRIYVVTEERDDGERRVLVRAGTPAQAIRHVVADQFTAAVASQSDLVELLSQGAKVREATA